MAGRRSLVRAAANRLGAPGVAGGATLGQNQNLYQVREGIATHAVKSAAHEDQEGIF